MAIGSRAERTQIISNLLFIVVWVPQYATQCRQPQLPKGFPFRFYQVFSSTLICTTSTECLFGYSRPFNQNHFSPKIAISNPRVSNICIEGIRTAAEGTKLTVCNSQRHYINRRKLSAILQFQTTSSVQRKRKKIAFWTSFTGKKLFCYDNKIGDNR